MMERKVTSFASNIILSLLIKGGAMIIGVILVPSYINYFDDNILYGVWITISSIFLWILLLDFGIGNGLRNFLTKSISNDNIKESKRLVSSAYMAVAFVTGVFFLMGLLLILNTDWNSLLSVSEDRIPKDIFKTSLLYIFTSVCLFFFFQTIFYVFYAVQLVYLPGLFTLAPQLSILVFLHFIPNVDSANKLLYLSQCYLLSYNLPILIGTILFFKFKFKFIIPSIRYVELGCIKAIGNIGLRFFIIQFALLAVNSTNEFYIGLFSNPESVVNYTLYYKFFYLFIASSVVISQPLWATIAKSRFEGNWNRVYKMFKVIPIFCLILLAVLFVISFFSQFIFDIWLGDKILTVDNNIYLLFSIYVIIQAFIFLTNSFANALDELKVQVSFTLLAALLKCLILCLLNVTEFFNWVDVIWVSILSLLPLAVVNFFYVKNILKQKIKFR